MIELAIVGMGSWGLTVLERTVSRARTTGVSARAHVVEPGAPGGGVYALDQPDYLVLNNPCGQLSLYPSPEPGEHPPYAIGLFDWAVGRGYRWCGHECRIGQGGAPLQTTDYLPRRLMGEYLAWFYATLVAAAPPGLDIVHHATGATDIVPTASGRERLLLGDGTAIEVDHVVLTSGHTWNDETARDASGVHQRRPYPVDWFRDAVPAGAPLAVAGMGLVGFDVVTALTVGRGGHFADVGPRKRYVASGHEPVVHLFSRSGVPYCAKSAHGVDPTGDYRPVVCTAEAFRALRSAGVGGTRRPIDFRGELLPLLFAEMQSRFHTHSTLLTRGRQASQLLSGRLHDAWADGTFAQVVKELEADHGQFDPVDHLFAGAGMRPASSADYQQVVTRMVSDDLDEALTVGGSPIKAAQEVVRILRDQVRSVIEFGGLSLESYIDFQSSIRGRINRLEAGPPPLRSQQLLALLDAGVVRIPFGPAPELSAAGGGGVTIRSTRLDQPYSATVGTVVRGHLDLPSLARSASPLLRHLYGKGRLTQLSYGDVPVGSVAISEDFHPYDAEGRVQSHLSLLGVLTEGVRYFTHYLPSPKSRLRAVLDAEGCVGGILG